MAQNNDNAKESKEMAPRLTCALVGAVAGAATPILGPLAGVAYGICVGTLSVDIDSPIEKTLSEFAKNFLAATTSYFVVGALTTSLLGSGASQMDNDQNTTKIDDTPAVTQQMKSPAQPSAMPVCK